MLITKKVSECNILERFAHFLKKITKCLSLCNDYNVWRKYTKIKI